MDSAVYLSYNQRLFNTILWVDTIMLSPQKFHLWVACPQNRIPDAMRSLKNQKVRINETEFLLQFGVRVCCLHLYIVYIVFLYFSYNLCSYSVCSFHGVLQRREIFAIYCSHKSIMCNNSRKSKFYKTLHKTLQVCSTYSVCVDYVVIDTILLSY